MVQEFEKAAFALAVSKPDKPVYVQIKTGFGYHCEFLAFLRG